jgi:HPt (histidine-containing phosphotransfer) domain-containing protein
MEKLLELFFETSEHNIQQLSVALQNKDIDALHRASHTLQGMLANYSAAPALKAASDLAQIARAGKLAEAAQGIRVVVYEMNLWSAALKEFQKHP